MINNLINRQLIKVFLLGKNFVVQFIANTLFSRGVRSKFFKLFIASRDFPHNDKIDEYRETIIKTIESTVSQCHTNLFVFDETDKIPIGLIDTIKAYIDFYQEVIAKDLETIINVSI